MERLKAQTLATPPDDKQQVEVVGRAVDESGAGRCRRGARARLQATRATVQLLDGRRCVGPVRIGRGVFAFGARLRELEMEPTCSV